VGAILVCLLAGFTQITRAFNVTGPDPQTIAWQQYRWQIAGAITLLIIETLLIAFMLIFTATNRFSYLNHGDTSKRSTEIFPQ